MSLIRYRPWGTLQHVQDEVDRIFNHRLSVVGADGNNSAWSPSVDISEQDDAFVLHADVPGVDPKEIEITAEDGVLTISGERSIEHDREEQGLRRSERMTGKFYRRFSLPDGVNADGIEARSNLGVLTITLPKQVKLQPRRIDVDVA